MSLEKGLKVLGCFVVMAFTVIALGLHADVHIKQKNHTDGFSVMGRTQPPKDEIFETWMGKDRARLDHDEETSIIVRLDQNRMYLVNHGEMKYAEMTIEGEEDILSQALAGSGLSEEERAQAQKMMKGFASMMKPSITVTETGEKKKIKNWDCRKYIMKMNMMGMASTSEVWATEDIRIDYGLYRSLMYSMMGQMPGLEDMLKEMNKIKGVVVLSTGTMSMMGTEVNSSQELLEVSEKSAPAGTYEVPSGYKKEG